MKRYLSKACSLMLVIVMLTCAVMAVACKQGGELINAKQWYLENTGDAKTLAESEEYNQYTPLKKNVDIGYREMTELLAGKDAGEEVVVALLDTGVDFNHEGLKNTAWIPPSEKDTTQFDGNFTVDPGSHKVVPLTEKAALDPHGTGCAGIIAAQKTDAGITGVASTRKVKILSVNITNDSNSFTSGRTEDLISAIHFAEANGAKVCNISFSTKDKSQELEEVMRNSLMLFVVSAGNGEPLGHNIDKNPLYPASFNLENIITVANLNYNGKLNKSSNFGEEYVDIAAPGTCIYTTAQENADNASAPYAFRTGTSLAAPMVSAVASVMFSVDKTLSASEAKNIIMKNSNQYASLEGKIQSAGSLNAHKAVEHALRSAG